MENVKSARKDWCDLARGFLMFLVFVYHSEVYYGNEHTWSWTFMPFFLTGFIFLSGYFFCSDFSKVSLSGKCFQVIRSIVIPYLCFMFVFFIPKVLFVLDDSMQQLIDIILFRASWFVVVIGVLQIVYAIIMQNASMWKLIASTIIMFAIGYAIVVIYRFRPDFIFSNIWLESHQLPGRLPLCINLALVLSPFYLFGILYRKYEDRIKLPISWGFLITILLIYIAVWTMDHFFIGSYAIFAVDAFNNILLIYVYALIAIACIIVASKKIDRLPLLNYVGKFSLLFYYFNGMALTMLVKTNGRLHILTNRGGVF